MTAIPVSVARHQASVDEPDLQADVDRARRLARLLDSEFSIGGFRFGLDALAGLVPVLGDTISLLAGLYSIHVVRKHGLGKRIEQRMIANLLLDYVGGLMPVVGDLFDAWFKANEMNVKLLDKAARDRRNITSSRPRRRSS
jgi:hypothetical protein